ncbi:M20/M25/M40 family metallo-hydrolase [Bacillus ndiopicus]|uniref:M20/M25/M40 family metallo-hydrolase n=1 Tax=Bacillus ndiopicus TaxID=1347368 RepID=UPI0005A7B9D6|nr:M20/M25/M40 family metallo-hydrolase [Bacillus ndiopicus]
MTATLEGKVLPNVKEAIENLIKDPAVQKGFKFIEADHQHTIEEQIEITEIPAPPFKERKRAENFMHRLQELNVQNIHMDSEGNVYGFRLGTGNGPKIVISAHLDTVFPEGTDVTVKSKNGVLYAPGISDDTRGLAELLAVIRAINEANIKNIGDIIFCGTVGEEGAGDLRGVKAFFNDHQDIDGFISIDGPESNGIVYLGAGSYRYNITYKGPGGHSFGAFGLPSATHALGRAIANIADLQTPSDPKTTFTVGEVTGGTTVNAIAAEASMKVDLRSSEKKELDELAEKFLAIVQKAADDENKRWETDAITVEIDKFGNRPSAKQAYEEVIVQAAWAAIEATGETPKLTGPSSTDANYPLSIGVPSITLGRGGKGGGAHTLGEWFNPTDGHIGIQKNFLTLLSLVGVEGVCAPLLQKKN